ncbi:MAG: hypothetical protein V7672_00870 [Brevundimonas sp.]|uniref:hypothetical protein n=1 Tax=Brevundimonas sp. TaxID=1871086 RepID=UPI003003250B
MNKVTAFAAFAFAIGLSGCDRTEADAKQTVAAQLKDPSSAQFRNVITNGSIVCGEVNGKNSWGAYAGFTRFIAADEIVIMEPDGGEEHANARQSFDTSWSALCGPRKSYERRIAENERLIAEGEKLLEENR